jgi:transcription termination/antitermination protein NusA
VVSNDPDVDPVGACVGMKGTRVQSVVQELRGEKIDIVHWTLDPAEFVVRALAPARVSKIVMDEDEHGMEVIVPDDQLSLAIGRKGQNVRLASKLTGWRLDVRSESEAEDEARRVRQSLGAIPGVSDVTAELLLQHGYKSAGEVAETDEAQLAEVEGIDAEKAKMILASARALVEEERRLAAQAAEASEDATSEPSEPESSEIAVPAADREEREGGAS